MPLAQASDQANRPWCTLAPEVAKALRPELPALADEIIAAVASGVPAYARPIEGAFGVGLRAGVEEALGQFVDEIAAGEPTPHHDAYVNLGRGEVRAGRSLEGLLGAYRLGARVAWRRLAAAGRRAGLAPDTLYLLAESIFAYIDELSAESAEGYAVEQSAAVGAAQLRRRRLVALLVADPAGEPAGIEGAAQEAGWPLPRTLAALVAPATSAGPLERALPAHVIAAPVGELLCALVADPDAPGRRGELERAVDVAASAPAAPAAPAALGPTVGWAQGAVSFARGAEVLRLVGEGTISTAGLVVADEYLTTLMLCADRRLASELARTRLAPLEAETPASRERLAATLEAWLAAQGRIAAVAQRLHVHPQTVRYRVARLRELFGERLEDPDCRFELELALRSRALQAG